MALPLTITNGGASWIAARIADNTTAEIDRVSFYTTYIAPSSQRAHTGSSLVSAKDFTSLTSDTGSDGSFTVSARDNSNDSYSYQTVGVWSGSTLIGLFSQAPALITKSSSRDLVVEIGIAVSDLTVGGQTLTLSVTGVNRATTVSAGTVRLMTAAEVAAGGAADAVPTGNDVATLAALVAPNARLARFTANGTWAKPANAQILPRAGDRRGRERARAAGRILG